MSDSSHSRSSGNFEELVPWADPYIVALIEKLRHSSEFSDRHDSEPFDDSGDDDEIVGELPPPSPLGDPNSDTGWQADWSPRNWPRH